MDDYAWDPNEYEEDAMGESVRIGNAETESNGRRFQDTPPDFVSTMRNLRVEMKSYREDNEIFVNAQEEQNQLNVAILQSLTYIQRRMKSRVRIERPEGSKTTARRRKRSLGGSSDFEGSTGGSISSSHRDKRKGRC